MLDTFVGTWLDLEGVTLGKIGRQESDPTYMWNLKQLSSWIQRTDWWLPRGRVG